MTWATLGEDDPSFNQPFDVALITIGPDSLGTLPAVTPTNMYLGDPGVAFNSRHLTQDVWSVGYGNNAPAEWTADAERCVGCEVRRSGAVGDVQYGIDSCEFLGPIPVESDCWETPLFFAKSISEGNFSEPSKGDSGGGLFFNIDLGGCAGPNQITSSSGVVAGVLSAWSDDTGRRSRWAPLGTSSKFICDNLNIPVARTLAQLKAAGAGVYTRTRLKINDRAHVVRDDMFTLGADVASGGSISIGVEAVVGNARANGTISIADRAAVQGVALATSNISIGNGVSLVDSRDGGCTRFDDFSLSVPFAFGTSDLVVNNDGQSFVSPGGSIRDVTVRARGKLELFSGTYVVRDFLLEPGATLVIHPNTWVFVLGTGAETFRGDIQADPGSVFFGIPPSASIFLGGEWRGALVAPKASIVADMHDQAKLVGSFFADALELHQGRFLQTVPFLGSWVPTCDANFANCR